MSLLFCHLCYHLHVMMMIEGGKKVEFRFLLIVDKNREYDNNNNNDNRGDEKVASL